LDPRFFFFRPLGFPLVNQENSQKIPPRPTWHFLLLIWQIKSPPFFFNPTFFFLINPLVSPRTPPLKCPLRVSLSHDQYPPSIPFLFFMSHDLKRPSLIFLMSRPIYPDPPFNPPISFVFSHSSSFLFKFASFFRFPHAAVMFKLDIFQYALSIRRPVPNTPSTLSTAPRHPFGWLFPLSSLGVSARPGFLPSHRYSSIYFPLHLDVFPLLPPGRLSR